MNIMILILIVSGIVLFFGGGFLIYMRMKSSNSFTFLLVTRDVKNLEVHKAGLKINEEGDREFILKKLRAKLPLKQSNLYFNNQRVRLITYDEGGEIVYVEKGSIEEKNFLKVHLKPEEKQIALNRLKDNTRHYTKNVDKWQAMVIVGMVILFIVSVLGISYGSYNYAKAASTIAENSEDAIQVAKAQQAVAQTNKEVSAQLAAIAAALTNDENLTRRLT